MMIIEIMSNYVKFHFNAYLITLPVLVDIVMPTDLFPLQDALNHFRCSTTRITAINFGSVVDNRLRSKTIYTGRLPALRA